MRFIGKLGKLCAIVAVSTMLVVAPLAFPIFAIVSVVMGRSSYLGVPFLIFDVKNIVTFIWEA